jgi:hypothetical protein
LIGRYGDIAEGRTAMSSLIPVNARAVVPEIHEGPLQAEYSTARSEATGGWVAVGTVHALIPLPTPPAWILVGFGGSELLAIEDLRRQLVLQRQRVERRIG